MSTNIVINNCRNCKYCSAIEGLPDDFVCTKSKRMIGDGFEIHHKCPILDINNFRIKIGDYVLLKDGNPGQVTAIIRGHLTGISFDIKCIGLTIVKEDDMTNRIIKRNLILTKVPITAVLRPLTLLEKQLLNVK